MGRQILAVTLFLTTLGTAGCANERADTWERYEHAFKRWYPIAWGSAPSDEELAKNRRRFDCAWERLEHPADEFACVIRATDEMVRCAEDPGMRGQAADCLKRELQACSPSPAFKRASWECTDARERPLTPTP
jgi:hypothetical protein